LGDDRQNIWPDFLGSNYADDFGELCGCFRQLFGDLAQIFVVDN